MALFLSFFEITRDANKYIGFLHLLRRFSFLLMFFFILLAKPVNSQTDDVATVKLNSLRVLVVSAKMMKMTRLPLIRSDKQAGDAEQGGST